MPPLDLPAPDLSAPELQPTSQHREQNTEKKIREQQKDPGKEKKKCISLLLNIKR
jgi:hypothetical protein